MCGIAGMAFANPAQLPDRDTLVRMTATVRHRGPDGAGVHLVPGAGLGVRRLAIVDVETGDQPIGNEDGSVVMVCNGEIYNFVELRRELESRGHRFRTGSDVEVIVHLYEELGPTCVSRLRGMFGFALWDGRRRRLMLARDRLGIKPLHYANHGGTLAFGSEQKSILASGAVDRELDLAALRELFTLGFVRSPRTPFARIRSVPPAHYLLYERGAVSYHRYWQIRFPRRGEPEERRTATEWAEGLRDVLTESVRLHLRSDVPVGAWLSGGLDSSAVVALMARELGQPIRTFSLGFEPPEFDELHHQRTLDGYPEFRLSGERAFCGADALKHLPAAIWHLEHPSLNGIPVARMILSETAARGVKVVLTGEGADEVLGGYDWFRGQKLLGAVSCLPLPWRGIASLPPVRRRWPRAARLLSSSSPMALERYRTILSPRTDMSIAPLWSADLRARLASADGDGLAPVWHPDDFDEWDPFSQLQHYELTVRLPDLVVFHVDRASMAHGLEARVPFLDHELVEFCARIPPRLKLRFLREKYILRRAMAGTLPSEIAWRRKRGLRAPAGYWLRAPLPAFADHLLDERTLRDAGYFDPAAVRTLVERHRAGAIAGGSELLGVLTVQLWDEMFRRGSMPPVPPHTPADWGR